MITFMIAGETEVFDNWFDAVTKAQDLMNGKTS